MLSQEDENISFSLPANKTVLSFLQLKLADKIKSIELGMKFLQQGNQQMQCWNNEEWTSKLERERETNKQEIIKHKQELALSKQQLYEINNKHKTELDKLGIDILTENFTFKHFMQLTENKKQNICSFLLDQKKFAGLGNYIKNEVLYLSKISPFRKVNNLSKLELKRIYNNIKFVSFSNVVEWFNEYEINIPNKIKKLLPKRLKVPYEYYVFEREYDNKNNKFIYNKTHCGRRTFYVKEIQI